MEQGLLKDKHGNKFWFKDGQRHCEDGPAIVYMNGSKAWYQNGKPHREDGPAVEWADGDEEWYLNGKRHRTDGPAVKSNSEKRWYLNGELHRTDGPAVECEALGKQWFIEGVQLTEEEFNQLKGNKMKQGMHVDDDGTERWYKDDVLHREDGPATASSNGYKAWYLNGKRHRTHGPAVEWGDGGKEWFLNGKRHRTDGPAIEYANGDKYWYFDGVQLTEAESNFHKKSTWSDDQETIDMKRAIEQEIQSNKDFYIKTMLASLDKTHEEINTNSILCSFVDLVKDSENKLVYFYYGIDHEGSVAVYTDLSKETGEVKAKYEIYVKELDNGYISFGFDCENLIGDVQVKSVSELLFRVSDLGPHYERVLMDIRGYMGDVAKWPKEIISTMMQEVKPRRG